MASSLTRLEALDIALARAALGIPCFPVKLSLGADGKVEKKPATPGVGPDGTGPGGFHWATTDPDKLTQIFTKMRLGPGESPGVGEVPGWGGRIALDVDIKGADDGPAALDELAKTLGELPETETITTVSGGLHLIFTKPDDTAVSNKDLAPGVEVRSDSGYVISPGVRCPWGEWISDGHVLAELPTQWWDRLLHPSPNGSKPLVEGDGRIPHGNRHNIFVSEAGSLRRRGWEPDEIADALLAINRRTDPPLEEKEIREIAASATWDPAEPLGGADLGLDVELAGEIPVLPRQKYTDDWNAAIFAHLEGDDIRFITDWSKWVVWDGIRWIEDHADVLITERAKSVAVYLGDLFIRTQSTLSESEAGMFFRWMRSSANKSKNAALVHQARGIEGMHIDSEKLDADPWALHVANGWIDLKTGEHHPPNELMLNTKASLIEYDPTATAPTWERCLEEWHPDPDQRDYVQRLAGEAIVGSDRDHLLAIHWGGGANGKSTFINALTKVLGPYFISPHKSLLVDTHRDEHQTVVASLFRVRLAVAAETETRARLNQSQIKNLTGGDELRARRMREDEWSFKPTHTLWLQTNHLPQITGTDEGIWRRVKVVPWIAHFDGGAKDVELGDKLGAEAAGILNWLIAGALAWRREGLTEPDSVLEASAAYRRQEDKAGRFLDDCGYELGSGPGFWLESKPFVATWSDWHLENYGRTSNGQELLGFLSQRGVTREKPGRVVDEVTGKVTQTATWTGVRRKPYTP